MFAKRLIGWGLALGLALLAGCGGAAGGVTVSDAWVRNSPSVDHAGAAYLRLTNTGATDDRLMSVTTDAAKLAELHQTKNNNGVMEMSPVEAVVVPANGQAELKPGGYHVMLMGLTKPLTTGDKVTLTLKFEKAGTITVTADVRDQ